MIDRKKGTIFYKVVPS